MLAVKRSASPSPATGSAKAHEVEQKTLLALALTTKTNKLAPDHCGLAAPAEPPALHFRITEFTSRLAPV